MAPIRRIAVVGAGIIGVSTALRILQTMPNSEVTIFTQQTSPHTTSDVAAGFWGPSYITNTPHDIVLELSKETYEYLVHLATTDPHSGNSGVFLSPGYELFCVESPEPRYWSHIPIGFRPAQPQELAMFPSRVKSGFYFVSAVTEGSLFIPHLIAKFKALGGKLIDNRRIESFSELQRLGYRQIVNCSGLGAFKLCKDESVFPIRGQVSRVYAPWLKFWFVCDDGSYCLLNTNHAVLGGVAEPNNWDTTVSAKDKEVILARNYALLPPLKEAPVLADLVGLRPGRDTVRLEREVVTEADGVQYTLYHNYGHGGSGLTLFWGCARVIVDMIQQDLRLEVGAKL